MVATQRKREVRIIKRKSPTFNDTAYRINERIRVREVRLIDHEGVNHGVVSVRDALDRARAAGLDLVEVAPQADPPVARIMDYGKFSYEQTKKEKTARKHQKQIEIKTLRFSIDTAEFHRDIKVRTARKWLEEGKKVKIAIRFFGREVTRPEMGLEVMNQIATQLQDIAGVEQAPLMEGKSMVMTLMPAH